MIEANLENAHIPEPSSSSLKYCYENDSHYIIPLHNTENAQMAQLT